MDDLLPDLLEAFRRFARNEILPHALEADRDRDTEWVRAVWARAREVGLPGLHLPEACGGSGFSVAAAAAFLDAAASRCAGVASVFAYHFAAVWALWTAGGEGRTSDLKRLAGAAPGVAPIATVLFPSPGERYPLRVRSNGSEPVLEGECALAGNAALAQDFCLFAEEEGDAGARSCLLLGRDSPGLSFGEPADLPGLKVNPFLPLRFHGVKVPDSGWVGERGRAERALERSERMFHGFVAAMAMGLGRDAFQRAHGYAGERYQFGRMILQHPEIQRMLGAMRMKLQVGRSACRGLFLEPVPDASGESLDAGLVKAYCTDAALEIALDAVQIHGGYGYMHAYGVEKLMRDSKVLQVLGDRNPALHVRSIAREL